MLFTGTVTTLKASCTGNKIKLVARAVAASSRTPAAIRHIAVLAWQTNSDFGVEPITADAGLRLHLTELGIDQSKMLGLLPKEAGAGGIAFLLQSLVRWSHEADCQVPQQHRQKGSLIRRIPLERAAASNENRIVSPSVKQNRRTKRWRQA